MRSLLHHHSRRVRARFHRASEAAALRERRSKVNALDWRLRRSRNPGPDSVLERQGREALVDAIADRVSRVTDCGSGRALYFRRSLAAIRAASTLDLTAPAKVPAFRVSASSIEVAWNGIDAGE
jgi:hypothetical protein